MTTEETSFDLLHVAEIRTECFSIDWINMDTQEIDHSADVHVVVVLLLDGRIAATAPSENEAEISDIGDGLAEMCKQAWMQASAHLN